MEATSDSNSQGTSGTRSWSETVQDALDYEEKRLRFVFVRLVLYVYTVLGLFSRYRELLLGPSYWVTSFRRLAVHRDKVLDDRGRDVTHLPEGPNFRGFLPSRAVLDPILIRGLYIPGRYPLAFVTLSLAPAESVSSIHIYVSTAFSDDRSSTYPFIRRDSAIQCSLMRKAENGFLIEVGGRRNIELRAAFQKGGSTAPGTIQQYYTGINRIGEEDSFSKRVQAGDTIVLWAEGRLGEVQHPRYASLQVRSSQ